MDYTGERMIHVVVVLDTTKTKKNVFCFFFSAGQVVLYLDTKHVAITIEASNYF